MKHLSCCDQCAVQHTCCYLRCPAFDTCVPRQICVSRQICSTCGSHLVVRYIGNRQDCVFGKLWKSPELDQGRRYNLTLVADARLAQSCCSHVNKTVSTPDNRHASIAFHVARLMFASHRVLLALGQRGLTAEAEQQIWHFKLVSLRGAVRT